MLQTDKADRQVLVTQIDTRGRLKELLTRDLNFHDQDSSGLSHDFHAFPAKFPPQLPQLFISQLTDIGERVLDPMMGSSTTILESLALGRQGIGFDIDPLAILISKVKTNALKRDIVDALGTELIERAEYALKNNSKETLEKNLASRFSEKTRDFVDYWFSRESQLELTALICEIEKIQEPSVKDFFLLTFSAIIITKSGGVSMAWDLAHTRPHRLNQGVPKFYRPALKEFRKRLTKNINGLSKIPNSVKCFVNFGNAESLPLQSNSVDLLFTSPPYASNAIDYMRAHKFSLIWMGKSVDELSGLRSKYIGSENVKNFSFIDMPSKTRDVIGNIIKADNKKGLALHRYYSEMHRVLSETYRVLKPGKAALFVVGTSTMRGIDSQTQICLGEIGESLGFELIGIGTRKLDRDRRMLPARLKKSDSQIEERMHEEYVVALLKP